MTKNEIAEVIVSLYKQRKRGCIIGIVGPSCAGKSTLSLDLRDALKTLQPDYEVAVIQADNFIYPNAWLESHDLMTRKGFPESFDFQAFHYCLSALKEEKLLPIWTPYYSQDIKDIDATRQVAIHKSHIYIVEGVNLFFSYEQIVTFKATQYLDFCIYLDTDRAIIKERALKRFFEAYEKAQVKPTPYFNKFIGWSTEAIEAYAEMLWQKMDTLLSKEYIEPYKSLADLLIKSYN